jgi:hypothetical protein
MKQASYDRYNFPVRLTILRIYYWDFYSVSTIAGLSLIKYYTGGPQSPEEPVTQYL